MTPSIHPVILCGGSGTRLWPLSRRLEPKQFQKLAGNASLFQNTMQRFFGEHFARTTVLVNAAQEPRVQVELSQLAHPHGMPTVVVEPAMRSTAAAIAAAATVISGQDQGAVLLVVPSDHCIGRPDRLVDAYLSALPFVQAGGIALFGIQPTAPETGFGYIRAGGGSIGAVQPVAAFVEKPNVETATQLLADGRHTWNSGIFMFRADTVLQELARFAPAVLDAATDAATFAIRNGNCIRLAASFAQSPDISVDHAVMEHSDRLGVVAVSPEWSDLGSFDALWENGARTADDNVIVGDALLRDVRRSYIHASRRLVSIVGLSNVVVVDTDDALLVASRAQTQDVKFIAQHLAQIRHPAADRHLTEQLTCGSRRIIDVDAGHRIEFLIVQGGGEMVIAADVAATHHVLTALSCEVLVQSANATRRLLPGQSDSPAGEVVTILNAGTQAAHLLWSSSFASRILSVEDESKQRKVS